MAIDKSIASKIEVGTGESIADFNDVGGGCIANSQRIVTKSGKEYFLKSGFSGKMFHNEAAGLRELALSGSIRIPEVIIEDSNFLLLEYIPQGRKKSDFFEDFGRKFASLHRCHSSSFGFKEDNFIGATPQKNIPEGKEVGSWTDFFFNKRLLYQFRLSEKKGYATDKLKRGFHLIEGRIEEILKGGDEQPSLLHGDLWSGNYMCDNHGDPVLIDPAVYYGHREADLAMTRLFGGFPHSFYKSYKESYPLPAGDEERENIYMLYHVMNHLNLFGSGYYQQALELLWHYL